MLDFFQLTLIAVQLLHGFRFGSEETFGCKSEVIQCLIMFKKTLHCIITILSQYRKQVEGVRSAHALAQHHQHVLMVKLHKVCLALLDEVLKTFPFA